MTWVDCPVCEGWAETRGGNPCENCDSTGEVLVAESWEREFFHLAASWLACRNAALDYPAPLPDGSVYCPYGLMVGELAVQSEMHMVMREAGMLPAQRLARCAGRLLRRV